MIPYGTYLGDKIQAVITKLYTIVFCIDDICAWSYMLKTTDLSCVHIVRTKLHSNSNISMDYLLTSQGGMNYVKGENFTELIGTPIFRITQKDNEYIWISTNGNKYVTTLYEHFENDYLTPRNINATQHNLSDCLKYWHLGVKILKTGSKNNIFLKGIEINTPKNMFLFRVGYNDIYIRSARYAVCNRGMVFQQNFRQFLNWNNCQHSTLTSFIDLNKPLPAPDMSLFCNGCCTDHELNSYWPVNSFDKNHIYLNGCGGDIYSFINPDCSS